MDQLAMVMRSMADMVRSTNERMEALEKQVQQLSKITPMQASELSRLIRGRSAELCAEYGCEGNEKTVAAAIRREIRLRFGVGSVKELAACEYAVARETVELWEDWNVLRRCCG